jgi:hypothetical protein
MIFLDHPIKLSQEPRLEVGHALRIPDGGIPAPPLEDRAWCRRVYLDIAGRIPSAKETDEFLAQPREHRREALADRLLASNEYAVRMRELWDAFMMGRAARPGVY